MAKLPDRAIPIILPSEIEAVKRLNFFELGLDDYMALEEYLLSPRSDADLKKYSYSKGGLIKKGIQKLLDSTAFNQSRRKFLKQAGATDAATAVPKSLLKGAATLAQASKLELPNAVPWIKSMTNTLKSFVDASKPLALKSTNLKSKELINLRKLNKKLPNGTTIHYLEPPKYDWDSHKLVIKTADGKEDAINFKEYKDDIHIEFDIRDDFANNQHLEINKKTGYTEMIDENFTMAPGGEDIIKDDPIVWAIEKTDDID